MVRVALSAGVARAVAGLCGRTIHDHAGQPVRALRDLPRYEQYLKAHTVAFVFVGVCGARVPCARGW